MRKQYIVMTSRYVFVSENERKNRVVLSSYRTIKHSIKDLDFCLVS